MKMLLGGSAQGKKNCMDSGLTCSILIAEMALPFHYLWEPKTFAE